MAESITLLDAVTAAGAGAHKTTTRHERTFQAVGTTTSGTGAAVVEIQGSNVATPTSPAVEGEWSTFAVLKLKLAVNKNGESLTLKTPFRHVRAKLASISGTGAAVSAYMGV